MPPDSSAEVWYIHEHMGGGGLENFKRRPPEKKIAKNGTPTIFGSAYVWFGIISIPKYTPEI